MAEPTGRVCSLHTTNVIIRKRIAHLFLLLLCILGLLVLRLGYLQFVRGDDLRQKAINNRMRDIPVEAKRGTIYDRNGNELVTSVSADSVYAIPGHIKDPQNVAAKLAPILDMDQKKLYQILTRKSSFEWLKRKINADASKKIKDLKISGLGFAEESRRYYPQDNLAPQILGFTGTDNQGLMGVEAAYDKDLKGVPGEIVVEHDAGGRDIPQALEQYKAPKQGNNLVLTLDKTIQQFTERELDKIVAAYHPKNAVIIVMDPKTGEILAMGSRPTFSLSHWSEAPKDVWDRNPAIWYNYEPGSTFKIVTTASALQEGTVKPSDRFYDPGYVKVADRTIRCWLAGGHGSESFEEVVQNSCNPGFVQVGLNLGKERFYKYIRAFGFGQPTDIGLPGEADGIMIPEKQATNLNIATMAIGQSIAVTPIQLVTAAAAVANGGNLIKPHLVKSITDQTGQVLESFKPQVVRRVISEETAKTAARLLQNVVFKGSGRNAYVNGYAAAGKTGTAQVVGERGGYVSGKYVASFVGFAPVNDPKMVALVMISEPQGGQYYGGAIAAPVFSSLALDTLRYMGVPEQKNLPKPKTPFGVQDEPTEVTVPQVVNLPVDQAQKLLRESDLAFETRGDGRVVYGQIPESGAKVLSGTTVVLDLQPRNQDQSGDVTVPDLTGLTVKQAGDLLQNLDLNLNPSGSGTARSQSPKPGSKLPRGSIVQVEFAASAPGKQ